MLMRIPTYEVIVDPDGPARRMWRVPKTDLEAFLHVLTFNAVEDFRVVLEPDPSSSPTAMTQSLP